jgi:hypothetical protein
MAARLIRRNRKSAGQARRRIIAAAGFGAVLALLWVERDMGARAVAQAVAHVVDWLLVHSLVCGGLAALASAIQVARRRVLKRAEFARSWLAAVPTRPRTARWEALIIETLPATAAFVALTVLGLVCALALSLADAGRGGSLFAVWAILSAGVALGAAVSYAVPAPKPVDLPPGSRYVPHRKTHRAATIRPSLAALGLWPVRQMFAWAQPKMVARATLPILVMMPMGTTADDAMGVIAVFGVTAALVLLWMAAIQSSRLARRWMAPLPVGAGVMTRALLLPTFGVMVGASAVETLLLLAFGVSYRVSVAAGICTAVVGCLASMAGVLLRSARPKRTR